MLNHIWLWMIILSILIAGGSDLYSELTREPSKPAVKTEQQVQAENSGDQEKAGKQKPAGRNLNKETKMGQITSAAMDAAGLAVKISIGLIGIMALWLGIMRVAEHSGAINVLAKIVQPITKRLFPGIPSEHPAVGAMVMNIAANMMGLSNAATPLGLKAMEEMDKLNPKKGEATDDMITFLVINTSAITIPATAIAIRASMGSANPQQIIVPGIMAATVATIVGVTTVKTIQYFANKKKKTEKA